MAILKSNKKASEITLEELKSPVIEKIMKHNERKANSDKMVSEQQEKMNEVQVKIQALQEEFTHGGDLSLFEEIAVLESQHQSMLNMKMMMDKASKNGLKPLEITAKDKEDLTKTFAPYRKKQDELTAKLVKQIEEMSKTLDDLEVERADYWELYAKINGHAHGSTGDIFAVSFLKDNQDLIKASGDLGKLAYHNAFPKSFYQ
ncbi:hypothetical protein [Bacillus sp. AFS031507]|uniref:hypothetical protein n=1 Tax=Bacillus sp. AFS031507 TaxID=2033496 RepID=UPI000BFEA6D6|nr:hypothetical protein [Bacillus sp. AFS031507]PGY13196.1 hypothetical protein COE25_08550 [Bacillus sp. AFS031507]